MKTLVLYVFHELNERVNHFIKNCIFYDKNVDFIVICNNKSIEFTVPQYVTKFMRDNEGFDFGAWSDALLTKQKYKSYDYFIFANSSIIGPFLKPNFKQKWTDIYINGLQKNIKLFGSTINTIKDPINKSHVQSYIFSMNKTTLIYLIKCGIFSNTHYETEFDELILNKEILMSRKIIEKKWNIGSLFKNYKNVDFTFSKKKPEKYNIDFLDDIMKPRFFNNLWNKYDLVFIKGNRINV
jgi:lipopolysaccharide biosynthesis protein